MTNGLLRWWERRSHCQNNWEPSGNNPCS